MTAIRVAFNVRFLSAANLRGIGRYAMNLLVRLPRAGVRPILCSNVPVHESHLAALPAGEFEVALGGPRQPLVWDQTWERLAARSGADLLHAPGNYGLPAWTRLPAVLTLHDAIDYSFYKDRPPYRERWTRTELISRWMHWSARRGAWHVITVSEYSRREIHRRLRIPSTAMTVTYEAADDSFAPADAAAIEAVRRRHGLAESYFFYIGGWEKRKNVEFLIDAFAAAALTSARLVLAGGASEEERELRQRAERLNVAERIVWLGRIEDAELPALYSGALAFVYPSRSEGFGLQLCEAMACRCPVLVARATCLPEILGDGGETFSLADPAELAALLRRVASEETFRAGLAERAQLRSAAFSWDDCAAQTVAVYRKLLDRKAR
jgi:glycosyltransferase involved in cell wall biosynthesis